MLRNNTKEALIKILSSFFYIGFIPYLPGTLATLAGLIIYLLFIRGNLGAHLIIVLIFTCAGLYLAEKAEKIFRQKDARKIVIDDFVGMLVSLLFLPYNLWLACLGFLIFRVMDGLKPYPIYKIERLHGSLGVMGDDFLAGIYTNLTLQIIWRLALA